MSEVIARRVWEDGWRNLLRATRHALENLRPDDLEKLVQHAESLAELVAAPTTQKGTLKMQLPQSAAVIREHKLLADLLGATDRNLRFLKSRQAHRCQEG